MHKPNKMFPFTNMFSTTFINNVLVQLNHEDYLPYMSGEKMAQRMLPKINSRKEYMEQLLESPNLLMSTTATIMPNY